MLVEEPDRLGNPLMICSKRRGGMGELRDFVWRRDLIREQEKLYRTREKGEEEDSFWQDLFLWKPLNPLTRTTG